MLDSMLYIYIYIYEDRALSSFAGVVPRCKKITGFCNEFGPIMDV